QLRALMARITQTRRHFIGGLAAIGGAGLLNAPSALGVQGRPETATLRLTKSPTLCLTPQYVAEEFLHAEGFTDIRYVDTGSATDSANAIGSGKADLSFDFASAFVTAIDTGQQVTVLSGAMVGCVELF